MKLSLIRSGSSDGGPESGRRHSILRPGFTHAGGGDFKVEIGCDGPFNQRIKFGIIEIFPPESNGGRVGRLAARQCRGPLRQRLDGRRVFMWSIGAVDFGVVVVVFIGLWS